MTSEGLGEITEDDSAGTCADKIPLVSMEGQEKGLLCEDPKARTHIGMPSTFLDHKKLYFIFK
jgi:hypothetical protein